MEKKRNLIIGIIVGVLAVVGIIAKVVTSLNKFKKNSDFFFLGNKEELDFEGEEFEDTCLASMMSHVTVDLSGAKPSDNPMNLCVKAKMSAVDVILPKDWNIKVQGENKMSNIENITTFDKENFDKPLLFVNYQLNKSSMNVYYGYLEGEEEIENLEVNVEEAIA